MKKASLLYIPTLLLLLSLAPVTADEPAWVAPMSELHQGWEGKDNGYVAQYGDSITNSMAFWSMFSWSDPDEYIPDDGLPKKPEKRWRDTIMGARDKGPLNGNQGGWRVENLLKVVPKCLKQKKPAVAIIMIGTNDIKNGSVPSGYEDGLAGIVQLCLDAHCIPIMSTIPPFRGKMPAVHDCNAIIRKIAESKQVPLVDYFEEIVKRRPDDTWDGTLMSADGIHPSSGENNIFTEENLKNTGYGLRSWVTFLMYREVYFRVLMKVTPQPAAPAGKDPAAGNAASDTWDWPAAMLGASKKFTGDEGKVVPLGDSITYANQSGRYARYGQGRSAEENAICSWMHAANNDKSNGWFLAADDQAAGRSWTAASGVASDEYIKGGKAGLPPLADILKAHNPQIAPILLGTNDLKRNSPAVFLQNMEKIYQACLDNGTIPIAQTIPPTNWGTPDKIKQFNDGIVKLAAQLKIPLIDVNGEFLKLRPGDTWLGTLISQDGAHPTHEFASGPPTEDNLKNCGHLLRCRLIVNKVIEIKEKVLDQR